MGGYQPVLTPLNETVKIGFWAGNALSYFSGDIPLIQVEFEFYLPWRINTKV